MSFHSGLVALTGRPNVGKSTLANALARSRVAAVSPRPQTTRRRITAVVHGDNWQAVLLDLPGFQRPADALTARMQATVDRNLEDCDAALFVLNAREETGGGDRFIAER
ncbi:MAG: GTPase, partial [Thermoleophilia bacterium]